MWATMKYVSCACQSNGNAATKIPEIPPSVNTKRKPIAYSSGTSKMRLPRQVVATQLKILIPVGTPISTEATMKKPLR